jgi:predicted regulator of Ras-like GTPase activity (Roadblock/LC7/MglB family)
VSRQLLRLLDRITRVRGVRGAMLVATDDGLVVAESLMEGVQGNAVAALAASLAKRFARSAEACGVGTPDFLHLQAEEGALLTVPVPDELLLVTVADADVNVGLVRLEMLRAVEEIR